MIGLAVYLGIGLAFAGGLRLFRAWVAWNGDRVARAFRARGESVEIPEILRFTVAESGIHLVAWPAVLGGICFLFWQRRRDRGR